ncbi:CreA family protein [Dongia rigui]|uniref:CreA family protein n=2 Tax=Dongia rigui TaxID=940149 RepID=A0ABU5E3J5_9PROT|nr:CreA family protein [Dongia rigui]MDY0873957.1 CreA family protein [Dongia rigui]
MRLLQLMSAALLTVAGMGALPNLVLAQQEIGAVSTTFRLMSPNDKVVIERYDDPKVDNVSCYLSRAETGGWSGAMGLAEDPSRFSIACRAVGPVTMKGKIPTDKKGEVVFSEDTSIMFKELRISRFYDTQKNVLVYLVWSTKLIDGSPYNSISVVPLN